MAVLVEAISVIVKADALLAKYPGGWMGFCSAVPSKTMCADSELVRVGFMNPDDVQAYIEHLEQMGLIYIDDGKALDLTVVDQMAGSLATCDWLEFGRVALNGDQERQVSACRLKGSSQVQVVTPDDWIFEDSLSCSYGFVPTGHLDKSLKFLRHENGLDVYLNLLTGKEVYAGRTIRRE